MDPRVELSESTERWLPPGDPTQERFLKPLVSEREGAYLAAESISHLQDSCQESPWGGLYGH